MRILRAAVKLAARNGAEPVPVSEILRSARVSRGTFYMLFNDRNDCLQTAIEEGVALAEARAVAGASQTEGAWVSRVGGALRALLELGEEEPGLARLCIARALVDPHSVKRLEKALTNLESTLDKGRSAPGALREPSELTARGITGGALATVYARLLAEGGGLVELHPALMGMIVMPYLGQKEARRQETRTSSQVCSARPKRRHARRVLRENVNGLRMTYRTMRVLEAIRGAPGPSNLEVARRAGIVDQGQVSKLLARLASLDLVENTGAGQAKGGANAWFLTEHGEVIARAGMRSWSGPGLRDI